MKNFLMVLAIVTLIGLLIFPFHLGWYIYRRVTWSRSGQPRPKAGKIIFHGITIAVLMFALPVIVPRAIRFTTPSKQSEAKTNLGAIFTTQVAYFGERNTYGNTFTLLNWEPEGESRYAYACGTDFIENTHGTVIQKSDLEGLTHISDTGFTCAAAGNIDNDPDLDYWTINDAKQIENLPSTDL